jgi:hypothetical protein
VCDVAALMGLAKQLSNLRAFVKYVWWELGELKGWM